MSEDFHLFLSGCMGLGLAAACGFRVFLPFLCLGLASRFMGLGLDPALAWAGTTPALILFSVATAAEIAAYYIPVVDNILDSIAIPAATLAGILITATSLAGSDPMLKWSLAIIAGGGVSLTTQLLTTKVRALSTGLTGGLANPVFATFEWITSILLTFLSILLPLLALGVVLVLVLLFIWAVRFLLHRLSTRSSAPVSAPG
ncbi:MAG: DUF4126 domain-containing protein [Verrucomicrobiae bacterium]|nr:DUF4126 domain-containing protein [Verrucomicrobiae bacterium]